MTRAAYARPAPSDAEHAWYMQIAAHAATVCAQALAKGTMRMGRAHRYLAAAHLAALFEHDEEAARAFLDEVVSDLTAPPTVLDEQPPERVRILRRAVGAEGA